MSPKVRTAIIAALVAVLATFGVVVVVPDDNAPPPAAPVVTTAVDGLDAGKQVDQVVTVPKAVVDQAAPTVEDGLLDETANTPGVDRPDAVNEAARANAPPALPTAGATAGFAGCRTSFVRNQSSRRGVRPNVQVLHYTVSPNRVGLSDVNAIVALFNTTARQASSNFVIDTEGHCVYMVPIEAKAWTQAAGNPYSISYEIVAMGSEPVYLGAAGMAKLKSVVHEVARRTGIPLRRGQIGGNCTPSRSGIVQHKDFGTCGGGHVDISPFPIDRVVAQLVGPTCNAKCERTRTLRTKDKATHRELRRRNCAPASRTRSARCTFLYRRLAATHAAAKRDGVKLTGAA